MKDWRPFQLPSRSDPSASIGSTTTTTTSPVAAAQSTNQFVANGHYLLVHPFTAMALALVQGLMPSPVHMVSGRRSSSAGAPATPSSGVSQQSTTTGTGFSDQHAMTDAIQLAKEEKATGTAYTNAIRTAQYLLAEMFKK